MKITSTGPVVLLPGGETAEPIEIEMTEEEYAEAFLDSESSSMEEWLDGIEEDR